MAMGCHHDGQRLPPGMATRRNTRTPECRRVCFFLRGGRCVVRVAAWHWVEWCGGGSGVVEWWGGAVGWSIILFYLFLLFSSTVLHVNVLTKLGILESRMRRLHNLNRIREE